MFVRRLRPASFALAMLATAIALHATPARAGSLPLHAEIRVSGSVDATTFERTVAVRYHIVYRKVVTTDIDRDGDVDIVAATEQGFTVWLNDGAGHLTSHTGRPAAAVGGNASGTNWQGRPTHRDEPMLNDARSVPLHTPYGHAPPSAQLQTALGDDSAHLLDRRIGSASPRAPPA